MNDAESGFTATNFACCGVDTSPYNVNRLVPYGPPGVDINTNPPTPLASTTCTGMTFTLLRQPTDTSQKRS
ncbi:unnamed protein product [Calypogeia fissa]